MKTLKLSFLIVLLTSLLYSCQKEYSLEGIVTPAGTWQFNDAAKLYKGNIDTAYIETAGTTKTMNLVGRSEDGKQNFLLHLYDTDTFTVGTYKASLFETDFLYSTQAKTLYQADQFIGEFVVKITAIGNNNVTGTFSGDSEDSSGTIKPITLGQFTARINLSGNGTGGGGGGGNTSVGTLGGSPNTCTGTTPAGTYTQGIALGSTNTATIQVNVTTPGTYTISTNLVNGVTFSKSGTFSATGTQSVVLNGSGIPVNSGSQTYTVTFGSSTCTFAINYLPGTPVSDYFPTTPGSFWAYGANATDSFLIKATSGTKAITGNTYNIFTYEDIPSTGLDSLYYRKGGGLYYENFNVQSLLGAPGTPPDVEYKFLDANVAAGTSWQSPNFTLTDQGVTYTVFIKMTLTEKATTPTTSGIVTSSDVLKVNYEYNASAAGSPSVVFFKEVRWFAKNIGLIYNSFEDPSGPGPVIYRIGRFKI